MRLRQTVLLVSCDGLVKYAWVDTRFDRRQYFMAGQMRTFVRRGESQGSYLVYEERPGMADGGTDDAGMD